MDRLPRIESTPRYPFLLNCNVVNSTRLLYLGVLCKMIKLKSHITLLTILFSQQSTLLLRD